MSRRGFVVSLVSAWPPFLALNSSRELAVGPQDRRAAQVDRPVLAVDPVGELRVVRQRADEEDRELAGVVDGQEEGVRDVAPVLLDVQPAARR